MLTNKEIRFVVNYLSVGEFGSWSRYDRSYREYHCTWNCTEMETKAPVVITVNIVSKSHS